MTSSSSSSSSSSKSSSSSSSSKSSSNSSKKLSYTLHHSDNSDLSELSKYLKNKKKYSKSYSSSSSSSKSSSSSSSSSNSDNSSEYSTSENKLTYTEKKNYILEYLKSLLENESNENYCYELKNGKWCNVKKFLHTSTDRLSTVGSGLLINNKDVNFIWKICESWDFTLFAEYNILKELEEMNEWCPHFVKSYGIVSLPIHPSFSSEPKKYVPFNYSKKTSESVRKKCINHVLLIEELEEHLSVYDYLNIVDENDTNQLNNIIYSIIMQTLLSIRIANEYCDFTHYDLHTSNIMMEDTDDDYRLYITKGGNYFFKTYGLSTMIIDTGYSFSNVLKEKPLDTCITNFTTGYTPICSNINHDYRTFFINMIGDFPKSKQTNHIRENFKHTINKFYKKSHIDMDAGWLKLNKDKIFVLKYYINDMTTLCSHKSIFYDYSVQCFDVLSHLLKAPKNINLINEHSEYKINKKLHKEKFMTFYKNFVRIENKLGNGSTFRKYIWKTFVDIMFNHYDSYSTQFDMDLQSLLKQYDIVINNFDFKDLYDSLKEYMVCYEDAIYCAYKEIYKQNIMDFKNVPSADEWLKLMQQMFSPNIIINDTQKITVYDSINHKNHEIKISSDEIIEFNKLSHSAKTDYILTLYKNI